MKIRMTSKEWKEGMKRVIEMLREIGMRKDVSFIANSFITKARIQLIDLTHTNIQK